MSSPYITYTSQYNCDKVDVRFTTHYDVSNVSHVVGVTGSCKYLGSWDPKNALLLERRGTKGCWSSVVRLPLSQYFEWKLMVIDRETLKIRKWEESPNRWNWIDRGPVEIIVGWDSKELIRCSSCRCLVGTCCCTTIYSHLAPIESLVDVTFRVIYSIDTDDETIALIGSSQFLGDWDPTISRLFPGHNNPVLTIQLPMNTWFEWKLAILDRRHRKVVRWEECENRALKLQTCPLEVGVAWSQVAEIGYKCYWLDPHWVVSSCPCQRRYCCNTIEGRGQLSNTLETPKKSLVCKSAFRIESGKGEQNRLSEKHEKSVHFPENLVTQVIERGENAVTSSAESLQELHIGIDSLDLDEMSYNNCLTLRHQTNVPAVSKNKVDDGESSGAEKQMNEVIFSQQSKEQTSDSNSSQLKQLPPEQQIENGDSQNERQRPNKESDKNDVSHPEKQQSNDGNLSQSQNVKPIDHSVDKLGTNELTNDTTLPENLNLKKKSNDLLERLKQPQKLSKSVNFSPPTKQPVSCGDLSLPAKQPQTPLKSSSLSVTTFQPEKLELSLPEKENLLSCGDLTMPEKQQKKAPEKKVVMQGKQPEKLGSCDHLPLTAKKPEQPFEIGDLSLTAKKAEDASKSVDLSLPAKQPDQIYLALQEELSRVVLSRAAKQPGTLVSYGDNSLQTNQTEEISCHNLSLTEKLPKGHSQSFNSSQPEKQPYKLSSTSDYSLQTKQPENRDSFRKATHANQSNTLPENGNLSSPLKQQKKPSENGNLSPPAKHLDKLANRGNSSLQTNQSDKQTSSDNSSLPAKQSDKLASGGNSSRQVFSKSVELSLQAKQPHTLVVSGYSQLPEKQSEKLPESVVISVPEKQRDKLVSSDKSSLPAKQPVGLSKCVGLSLPAKQSDKLASGSGYSSLPAKQPGRHSKGVVLSLLSKISDKLASSGNSLLPSKQSGEVSKSIDFSQQAKQPDTLANSSNSSPTARQPMEHFDSGEITLPVKQPKEMISSGELLQFNDERVNSIVQEQAKSNFSPKLFLTASSALALTIAGYRYFRQ